MNMSNEPETAEQLIALIRHLRGQRTLRKDAERPQVRRPLSTLERQQVYAKTAGRCHICGGMVDKTWQVDHVLARSGGGGTEADNYLAAHMLCNNYRWDYLPEEFQIILKLGVWVRTQVEQQTLLGQQLASGFIAHEKGRRKRRKDAPRATERQGRGTIMNAFVNEHGIPPETITLTSGAADVPKFSWRFRSWAGEPIRDTYGGKAVVDCEGFPVFAELAIIHVLKERGFDGAVWVDGYRGCFRDAMPPAVCTLPAQAREVYDHIATINRGRRGCWDVLTWNAEGVTFVECKRKGKDRVTSNQVKWLESALGAGLHLENFAICEWEIE